MLEVSPITDMMRATQMKFQDTKYMQNLVEHNAKQLTKQINSIWEQVTALLPNREETPEKIFENPEAGKGQEVLHKKISELTEENHTLKIILKKQKDDMAGMADTDESCDSEGDSVKEEMDEEAQNLQNDNDADSEYMNRECNYGGDWGYQGSIARYRNIPMPLRRMEAGNPLQTIFAGIISFDQTRQLKYGMPSPASVKASDNEYIEAIRQAGSSKPANN